MVEIGKFGGFAVKNGFFCLKFAGKDIDIQKFCKYTILVCIGGRMCFVARKCRNYLLLTIHKQEVKQNANI